jgi:hypothetical protein
MMNSTTSRAGPQIQQTTDDEVNWKVRIQSWVNGLPSGERGTTRPLLRNPKALDDKPNIIDIGAKNQRVSIPDQKRTPRRQKRMSKHIAIPYDSEEESDVLGQSDSRMTTQRSKKLRTGTEDGQNPLSTAISNVSKSSRARIKAQAGDSTQMHVFVDEEMDDATGKLLC